MTATTAAAWSQQLIPERAPATTSPAWPQNEAILGRLHRAQELRASSDDPPGDPVGILCNALDLLLVALEKKRAAARRKRRAPRPRAFARARSIPLAVRRGVWQRDGGHCTFTSGTGRRCFSRRLLEFVPVAPYAPAGEVTIETLCLLCRAHRECADEAALASAPGPGETSVPPPR